MTADVTCQSCGRQVSRQLITCPECKTPVGYSGGAVLRRETRITDAPRTARGARTTARPLTAQEESLVDQLQAGGRFASFEYCASYLIGTDRWLSRPYFIPSGQRVLPVAWKYLACSALLGWWGIPRGPVQAMRCINNVLTGGTDVSEDVVSASRLPISKHWQKGWQRVGSPWVLPSERGATPPEGDPDVSLAEVDIPGSVARGAARLSIAIVHSLLDLVGSLIGFFVIVAVVAWIQVLAGVGLDRAIATAIGGAGIISALTRFALFVFKGFRPP